MTPVAGFVTPDNPSTVITIAGEQTVRPPSSIADTVAVLITHDWGPLREPTLLSTFQEFEAIFGDSDTDGRDAVLGAFVGDGRPGGARAGAVIAYRAGLASGGSSAQAATATIQNSTPANALTLTALYPGTRGNRLSYVIEDDPVNPTTHDRLRILIDDVTVEKFTYPQTNVDNLVAAINSRPSKYLTATRLVTGLVLAHGSGDLTTGRDGTPVTVTEYVAGLDALEFQPFSVLSAANLTDASIKATIQSWVAGQEEAMRPVEVVFGGPAGEALDTAETSAAALESSHVIRLGAGTFHDDWMDKDVGTAKLASRVAGALAGIGEKRALTYLPFAGLSVIDPIQVTTDRLREAADAGVTVWRRSSTPEADLVIARGVSTWTTQTDPTRPYKVFREPRFQRILDLFLRAVKVRSDSEIIGLPNSEETRAALKDIGQSEINQLIADSLVLNDADHTPFFNVLDPSPDEADLIPFEFGWQFIDTTNFVVGQGRVSV